MEQTSGYLEITGTPLMKEPNDSDFPIAGVRAAKEFHLSVAASTGGFLTYHSEWLRLSGVSKKFSAVHVHRALCEALRLMRSYDQVDASTLATGEHLTRWMIQTELAVERNPLQPDYAGLDIVDGTAQLPDGRAATAKFTEWVSNRLKERASLWKQERLYQQERRHHRGKGREADGGDDTDSEEYGEGNKKKKKKKKKGEAAEKGDSGAQAGKGASGSK